MIEIKGDLWDFCARPNFVICITTNGFIKSNGCIVMGRGCAHEALAYFPDIDLVLGNLVREYGNIPFLINQHVASFPVKHHWKEPASLALIEQSARAFIDHIVKMAKHMVFVLPRPGCGNGRLDWSVVKPILAPILPDNVLIISKPND